MSVFCTFIVRLTVCFSSGENKLTQQYGFLKFDENELTSSSRLSEYIRLRLNTDPKTVVDFIRNGWRLQAPDLIISVTGGAKSFEMSTRLRKVFQRGLVSAAITTSIIQKFQEKSFVITFDFVRCMADYSRNKCWCCQRSW